MATIGRPLSLQSIIKTLRAIAADNPGPADVDMLNTYASRFSANARPSRQVLRSAVKELDDFLDRQQEWLGESTAAQLTKCIDSLAIMESKFKGGKVAKTPAHVTLDQVLAKTREYTPDEPEGWSDTMSTIKSEGMARRSSTDAIIGAIKVLLDEITDDTCDQDTFDTLHHLIDVVERLTAK